MEKDSIRERKNLKDNLFDRIKGVVYGTALGDAVGLSTEFMTEQQAKTIYGVGPIEFGNAKGHEFWRDRHRSRWFPNDFTDDTDQMLLILQCLLSSDGHLIPTHFAFRLKEWTEKGFPELNKLACGIGYTVGSVLSHPEFLSNPHKASYDVWDSKGRNLAANGAVMRTAVLGVPYFWNEKKVVENAIFAAKVTHADPRSVISSIIISAVISKLLLQVSEEKKEASQEPTNSETQQILLLEAGSPLSNYNVFEEFKQYDITLTPKSKAEPPPRGPMPFLKRLTSFIWKDNENDDLVILRSFLPNYKDPDNSRLTNPVEMPQKTEQSIDSYGTDVEISTLCEKIIKQYEFLLTSSSLSANAVNSCQDENTSWIEELHAHCFPSKLADLKLSESAKIGYTFKCLGSAIYCLTRARPSHQSEGKFFKTVITELTLQAGDADTNCAVAGALLGCRLGMKGLPKDWLGGLRHSEFLEDITNQLCDLVWSKYNGK